MPSSNASTSTFRNSVLCLGALFLLLVLPALSDSPRPMTVRVLTPDSLSDGLVLDSLNLSPQLDIDYGSYRWLSLNPTDLERLRASGSTLIEHPDAYQIRVPGYRFDPLVDGEPELHGQAKSGLQSQGGLRLVQMIGPTKAEWVAAIQSSGAKVLQYYPFNTYLVWADGAQTEALSQMSHVRWQGNFHAAYKFGDFLDQQALSQRLSVIYVDTGKAASTLGSLSTLGTVISDQKAQPDGALRRAIVDLSADALQAAASFSEVLWIAPQSPGIELEDEMSSQIVAGNHPGGVPVLGYFAHLASLGYDGSGVTWAVVDTGVDFDHPDLAARIIGGFSVPGTTCNSPPGSDCSTGGHGTHVAGIVGADASAGFTDADGFLYGLGVAPEVSFFSINIFGSGVALDTFSQQAVLAGASGSNNSWTTGEGTAHGYQDSERTYDFMVRDGDFSTMAEEPHIVVFSAGNSGPGPMTLTAPKEAKNVIVTAGTRNYRTSSDIEAMYTFSSRGPAVDGRDVPTIAAPGQTIASTRNDLGGSCSSSIGGTNNLYAFCTGTSMAAPQTSGALALAVEWWNDVFGVDPSPAMAKALLTISAVDITGAAAPIPNPDEGWGRIQVTELISPSEDRIYEDQVLTFDTTGEDYTLQATVQDTNEPLKVSLAWSDAPGSLGANPALVNNLDLEVTVNGVTYFGNDFSGGFSTTGGLPDVLNNLENVFVPAGASGTIEIKVLATNIAGDGVPSTGDATDQDFALICHNCVGSGLFADGFESGNVLSWSTSMP